MTVPPALRGPVFMIAASFGFALLGTVVKVVARAVPPAEIVVWRSAFTAVFLFLAARGSLQALRPVNTLMHLVRGTLGVGSMVLYFTALERLRLGDAVLLTYLSPLLVALLSPYTVGERPTPKIWTALLIGIVGVALVASPAGEDDPIGVLCGIGAACFAASAYLSIKVLTRTDNPTAIVFWFAAIATLLSSVSMLDGHAKVDNRLLGMLALVGLLGGLSQWALTRAYALARASDVSVYAYTTPVFAYLFGVLFLGDIPRPSSLIGALCVTLAGAIAARP